MKKIITVFIGLTLSLTTFAQFFDSVPYVGAFGLAGGTRGIASNYKGYNPDISNNDADWTKPWANFNPNATAYPGDLGYNKSNTQFYTNGTAAEKVVISSDITSDYKMTNDKWYELSGLIHVLSGATLTIEAGTCIRGNISNLGGLIITQGAKINAIADKNHPVVLTSGKAANSRVRGDWAGLLILGNASTNLPGGQRRFEALPADPLALYGGLPANDADNSGSIRYMRVEYAGYNYLPDQEINGVTFGGVGSSSHFDYIQSSFANDDAFEWFGGTCSHKYLIAFSGTDDDFDMDEGYSGKCQYLLGLRSAGITETSPGGACNGLEHDNNTNLGTPSAVNPNITAPLPTTMPTISNMTLVGPEHPGALKSSLSTLWQQRGGEAFRLRTNDATGVFNSITWGYATIVNLPNVGNLSPSVQTRAADDELTIRNTVIISSGLPDLRFNSSNFPTAGWASGVTPWTSLSNMRNWIMNGPSTSIYNFTGATNNDTTRTTVLDLGTSSSDLTRPDYIGASNGPLSGLDYTVCDFTLTAGSAFKNSSNFQHPRISLIAKPTVSVSTTFLVKFNQVVGTASASKYVVINSTALTASVKINADANFEVSANGTSGWASSITMGNTAADTLVYIRMNRATAGSSNGFISISSSKTLAEFTTITVAVSGTAIAPATPYINASVASLSFSNAVGSPSTASFVLSGKNIVSNVVILAPSNFEVSNQANTGFTTSLGINNVAGKILNTTVYVRYNPTIAGNSNAKIIISATGADTINIALNATSTPLINVLPGNVLLGGGFALQYPVMNIIAGIPSVSLPIFISGSMLTDTVKVNVPTNFQLSTDSLFTNPVSSPNALMLNTNMAASFNQKVYVRYNASIAVSNAGNLSVTSTGAPVSSTGPANQLVSLSGRAVAVGAKYVLINAQSYQLKFSSVLGVASPAQTIVVSGYNLATDSLVVNAPANWEISLDGNTYSTKINIANTLGTVAPTIVSIRYNPTVPMALNQFIIVNASSVTATPNSNTATNAVMLVYGVATPTVTSNLSALPTFYTTANMPSYANNIIVGGYNLTNNVVVNTSNGFEVSLDSIAFSKSVTINQTAGIANNTKVFVRFNSNTQGSVSGNYVTINTTNGSSIPVMVSAVAVLPALPVLSLSTASLALFNSNNNNPTLPSSFMFSANNLVANLSVSVGNDFELSNDSLTYKNNWSIAPDADGNIANTKLYCRYKRTSAGLSSDSIKFSSTALIPQSVLVFGKNTSLVNELSSINDLKLYPNPASKNISIEFDLKEKEAVSFVITNISGKEMQHTANATYSKGFNHVEINLDEYIDGLYFVNIITNTGNKSMKLSVIK